MPVQLTCVCAPSFLLFLRTSSWQAGTGNVDRMPWGLLNPVFLTLSSPVRHWFIGGPAFWEARLSSVCDNPQLGAATLIPLWVGQPPTGQQPWAQGHWGLHSWCWGRSCRLRRGCEWPLRASVWGWGPAGSGPPFRTSLTSALSGRGFRCRGAGSGMG